MFSSLSDRFINTAKTLLGRGRLTEKNIQESLREIRKALLAADVALPVVKQFIAHVRSKALGQQILTAIKPGDALVKIVHDELVSVLGKENEELSLSAQPPVVILLAGLQGGGKTTSCAKLAFWLKNTLKKSVMLASTDIYRPAAIEQLQILAEKIDVPFVPVAAKQKPLAIAKQALAQAKTHYADVLLLDTAGRLHVDQMMMDEIAQLSDFLSPAETLFVADSMTGQDAVNSAKAFNETLPLTGIILTKVDGDAQGGAALSIVSVTGKPIKFIGVGEKIDQLERFHPERIASQILGRGDILTLVEQAKQKVDIKESERIAKKIKKGKRFNLEDFLSQLQQMRNMGGVGQMLKKLPGMPAVSEQAKQKLNDKSFNHMEAIVYSMTKKERKNPDIINGSRKRRIAQGAGRSVPEVNALLKQFQQMQKMMKKLKGGGMLKLMRQFKGNIPPDMLS